VSKTGVQNVCQKFKKTSKKSSKKSSKKVQKKVQKKFEKKFEKKLLKITNCWREGRGGEGGELSFQCLRPSTLLMAAGKNVDGRRQKFIIVVG
jgi:hypothetical protein